MKCFFFHSVSRARCAEEMRSACWACEGWERQEIVWLCDPKDPRLARLGHQATHPIQSSVFGCFTSGQVDRCEVCSKCVILKQKFRFKLKACIKFSVRARCADDTPGVTKSGLGLYIFGRFSPTFALVSRRPVPQGTSWIPASAIVCAIGSFG